MTATADPFAPFLATIAERHYEMMFAPCPRCDGTRRVRYTDAAGDTDEKECPDCDKPRPADHGPAMVFADWLEERGDCEWAEFVRLGVKLAEPAGWHCTPACTQDGGHVHCPLWAKERRSDLLARHGAEWARRVLGGVFPMVHAMRDYGHSGGSWDVIGGVVKWDWGVALPETFKFPALAGFLGIGPALARSVPLRRVEFADKRPWDGTRDVPPYWLWHDESDPRIDHTRETHSDLPRELYELLEGQEAFEANAKYFPTAAAANAALSDAAIRRAVQQAKGKDAGDAA